MTNIFIKPGVIEIEGEAVIALVRDPQTLIPLAANGEWKTKSQYWTRRLRDRDVVEADPTASAPVAADAPAAPAAFAVCANCVTPEACTAAVRCVKAPLA
jgi:hypothetical protein